MELDDLAGALEDLDRAVVLRPRSALAWHNRACVKLDLGDPAGSAEDCTKALELEPSGSAEMPRISILLWPPDDFQTGAAITLDGPSSQSAAAIRDGETEWHVAAGGGVWVETYQSEQEATGRFRLDFEGGNRLEGRFQVRWFDPGPMLCG